jgi:acetyltransferase-like isoleucine patch superfamily enzyme
VKYFVHPQALCESKAIGTGTRVWAFAHVLPGARIGRDCNICDGTFIENDVRVGDRVTVKCGVQLWDGLRVEDDVFIGPNATFANDPFPRSKRPPKKFLETVLHAGASIGANATILPGLSVGRSAMVGAGAVVVASVPAYAIVAGNPARIVGYCDAGARPTETVPRAPTARPGKTRVRGVTLSALDEVEDFAADSSRRRSPVPSVRGEAFLPRARCAEPRGARAACTSRMPPVSGLRVRQLSCDRR